MNDVFRILTRAAGRKDDGIGKRIFLMLHGTVVMGSVCTHSVYQSRYLMSLGATERDVWAMRSEVVLRTGVEEALAGIERDDEEESVDTEELEALEAIREELYLVDVVVMLPAVLRLPFLSVNALAVSAWSTSPPTPAA